MAKVDTEVLFLKIKQFIKDNISTVVASINADKNDSTTIAAPESNAYIDLSLDSNVSNYDSFIFIYIDSILSKPDGGSINKNVRFEICLFKAKSGKDDENIQGLRYMRLMEELGQMAWDKALKGFRYEIETLTPVDVQLQNSNKWHKVYGVALTVSCHN
jgi:hypothetical protein